MEEKNLKGFFFEKKKKPLHIATSGHEYKFVPIRNTLEQETEAGENP